MEISDSHNIIFLKNYPDPISHGPETFFSLSFHSVEIPLTRSTPSSARFFSPGRWSLAAARVAVVRPSLCGHISVVGRRPRVLHRRSMRESFFVAIPISCSIRIQFVIALCRLPPRELFRRHSVHKIFLVAAHVSVACLRSKSTNACGLPPPVVLNTHSTVDAICLL
jgi:hypothetical protein